MSRVTYANGISFLGFLLFSYDKHLFLRHNIRKVETEREKL